MARFILRLKQPLSRLYSNLFPGYRAGQKSAGHNVHIIIEGRHSYGRDHFSIWEFRDGSKLRIGSFNSIAPVQTVFLGGNHRTDWITTFPFGHINLVEFPRGRINGSGHPRGKGDVTIENDVWISWGCTIFSGVRIGSGSVIGAKSVVTKDVPPYAIVAGNPAKVVTYRFDQSTINSLLEARWWDHADSDIDRVVPLLQSAPTPETISKILRILSHSNP
jgi:acetyltransferase-like isoleucine patch superfamily enzyme